MPLTGFVCPDGVEITSEKCLAHGGCRLQDRCCPLSVLRQIAEQRQYKKVTASMSGNGPRLIWLNAVEDFVVDPDRYMFAFLGVNVHDRMAQKKYTDNVLPEHYLGFGTADVLEPDEYHHQPDHYILYDYKTSGSFAIAKWAGIQVIKEDRPILDADGNPVLLKSGPNKGKVKTKQHREIIEDFSKGDRRGVALQVNRYRMGFNQRGFKISKMFVFGIPRDGGLYIAEQRGITKRYYKFPIEFIPDVQVEAYYSNLQHECDEAFRTGYARTCADWECWDGDRCRRFCDVSVPCIRLCKEYKEQWPGGDMGKHMAEKGQMI